MFKKQSQYFTVERDKRITQPISSFLGVEKQSSGRQGKSLESLVLLRAGPDSSFIASTFYCIFRSTGTSNVGKGAIYQSKSGGQARGKSLQLAQNYQKALEVLFDLTHLAVIHQLIWGFLSESISLSTLILWFYMFISFLLNRYQWAIFNISKTKRLLSSTIRQRQSKG